jgi:chromatin remodeling complex protein RSC6
VYVKEHKLQDPSDGRIVRPNQQMRDVFNVQNEIKLTQVMGLISKHLEEPVAPPPSS